jgi:hypothetical protein
VHWKATKFLILFSIISQVPSTIFGTNIIFNSKDSNSSTLNSFICSRYHENCFCGVNAIIWWSQIGSEICATNLFINFESADNWMLQIDKHLHQQCRGYVCACPPANSHPWNFMVEHVVLRKAPIRNSVPGLYYWINRISVTVINLPSHNVLNSCRLNPSCTSKGPDPEFCQMVAFVTGESTKASLFQRHRSIKRRMNLNLNSSKSCYWRNVFR